MKTHIGFLAVLVMVCLNTAPATADLGGIDLLETIEVGSWQVREVTSTDHKGKKTVSIMKSKCVGEEVRGGERCYWLETETQNFKIKKNGERKHDGERSVVKVLVTESTLRSDPANAINNLSGFGKEIIIQTGDAQPMRMNEGGLFAQTMMQGLGIEVKYDFQPVGTEKVTVPGGSFQATKIEGSGSVNTKILMKRIIVVENRTTLWLSKKVPFGTVKTVTEGTMNGKPTRSEDVLLEYGTSGAQTLISQEPLSMPGVFSVQP